MVFGFGRRKKASDERAPDGGRILRSEPHGLGPGAVAADGGVGDGPDSRRTPDLRITPDKVAGIISEYDQRRRQQAVSEIRNIRDSVEPMIEELMGMGRDLERDDLNVDSIDKHLGIIVIRGKKQVLDVIRRSVSPLPAVASIESAAKAESELRQLLKKVGDVLGRQTRVIHLFAKKHANRLKSNLEVMNSRHSEMRDILNQHNRADSESGELVEIADGLARRRDDLRKKSQRVRDLSAELALLESRVSELKSELAAIRSSKEHETYLELLSGIEECDAQMSQIRVEISAQFSKISRPLGRYEYGSSLDKEQQKVLAGLVADPAGTVNPENAETISVIFSNVRRAVATGSISAKDVEKTIALLAETADMVGPLAGRVAECAGRRGDLAGKARSAKPADLDECETKLSKAVSQHGDVGRRMETLRDQIKDDNSSILEMSADLQMRLRQHTGIRYEIDPPRMESPP